MIYWEYVAEELGLEESSEDDNEPQLKPLTSAGILPYAVFKRKVYFLLGKESYDPRYQDSDRWGSFGGRIEEVDESICDGAAREFYEETAGCVMGRAEARQKLEAGQYLVHSELHPKRTSSFRIYLMLVPYRDYPSIFRRSREFMQYIGADITLIEKSHLCWFTYKEVFDAVFNRWGDNQYAKKPKFRAKFSETMRRIISRTNLREQCVQSYANANRIRTE